MSGLKALKNETKRGNCWWREGHKDLLERKSKSPIVLFLPEDTRLREATHRAL